MLVMREQKFRIRDRRSFKDRNKGPCCDELCLLDTLLSDLMVGDVITTQRHAGFEDAVKSQNGCGKLHIVSPKCTGRPSNSKVGKSPFDVVLTKVNGSLHKEGLPLVLTLSDTYALINQYQAVFARISAALLTKSILYVGKSFQEQILLRQLEQIKALNPDATSDANFISRLTLQDEPELSVLYPQAEQIKLKTHEKMGRLEIKFTANESVDPEPYVQFLASILGNHIEEEVVDSASSALSKFSLHGHYSSLILQEGSDLSAAYPGRDIVYNIFYETLPMPDEAFISESATHWVNSVDSKRVSGLQRDMGSSSQSIFFEKIFSKLEDRHNNVRFMDQKFSIVGKEFSDIEATKTKIMKMGYFCEYDSALSRMSPRCVLTMTFPYTSDIVDLRDRFLVEFKIEEVNFDIYSNRAREIEMSVDYLNAQSTPEECFMLDGRFQDKLEEIDNRVYVKVEALISTYRISIY